MEIIRYFCIVKRFIRDLRTLYLAVFVFLTASAAAAAQDSTHHPMDSVEVSLLTCSPGNEVWSLYGHTAIRMQDLRTNEDWAVNYGMFNFAQRNFVLRFVFGLTDYEMGIEPFQMFLLEYARSGRGVVEQRLNLSPDEKAAVVQAIAENYLPQNRVYRYNYFYDNCTSRARDIIASHLAGKVEYAWDTVSDVSYRDLIHRHTEAHRWARFGNDLLLGVRADSPTTPAQQQFLPDVLRQDFDRAVIVAPGGQRRALVDSTLTVLRPNKANAFHFISIWDVVSPTLAFALLLAVVVVLAAVEWRRKKTFWLLDVTLLTLDGLAGLVLLAMVFSQHPTVNLNLQILLLNPLSLAMAYPVAHRALQGRCHGYWTVLGACILLFALGAFFQHYAEGMALLACALLIRVVANRAINGHRTTADGHRTTT